MSICILLQKHRYWSTNACNFYVPILSCISISFTFLGIITHNLFYLYLYIYNRPQVISILVKLFYCGSLQQRSNFYSWLTPQQQLDCCRLCSSPHETPIQILIVGVRDFAGYKTLKGLNTHYCCNISLSPYDYEALNMTWKTMA